MGYWLLKSEPESYGWADLVAEGTTEWTGVRNRAAAAHLRAMEVGDQALFYHSGKEKAAIGVMEVTRAARPEGDEGWVSVEVAARDPLPHPVTLAAMKAQPAFKDMAVVRQPRLSVSPVSKAEWAAIEGMAGVDGRGV